MKCLNIKSFWASEWTFYAVVCCSAALLAIACTPPVVPETSKQRLGAAYASYSGIVNMAAGQVEAGNISKEQALDIQARLQNVRVALDSSAGLIAQATPETDAQAVQLIQGVLLVLNTLSRELAEAEVDKQ